MDNDGEIKGGIDLGAGNDTVTLFGGSTMTGRIDLGGGGDRVDLLGGTLTGDIDLGDDRDILLIVTGSTFNGTADGGRPSWLFDTTNRAPASRPPADSRRGPV